ncbi:exodeoxyribonuclease V subunit beta [Hymenobacter sp. BT559]|uniref:UvrD-helicase domain-containing protein n=1 Tax=Hymenobacter sp. BT559 TaxID=2795729 RepID=UPI0018EB77DC|nr:UvrD-helicase domain-containing protein [Hymenobacter sp. BT559]MBJ6146297.1 UvrD-helicase domain-containing protein [Hymenobacter sp. BT559]
MSTTRAGFPVTHQQADVIDHVVGHQVTVTAAGAGSGKTYTSVATVLHLIETQDASIDQFVLISFTNKAANGLREDIQNAINKRAKEALTAVERYKWRAQQERLAAAYIGTIHGFCRQILQLFGYLDHIAYETGITFAKKLRDEAFNEALLAHYQASGTGAVYGGRSQMPDYELLKLIGRIYEHARNQGLDFTDISEWTAQQAEDMGKPYRLAMAKLMQEAAAAYAEKKREMQVLDPHDLIEQAANLLTTSKYHGSIAKQIALRYRYLFIDEFQDTDAIQQRMVEALIPHLKGLLVVGDQKQSIYAFRGTQDNILLQMAKNYMATKKPLPLYISRRPTLAFCKAANTLFEHIGHTKQYDFLKEPLEPFEEMKEGKNDPPPFIYVAADPADKRDGRIRRTAEVIRGMLEGRGITPPCTIERKRNEFSKVEQGDIVILTRSNNLQQSYVEGLREIFQEEGFSQNKFAVQADAGEAFYSLPEVVSVIYMLQLLLGYPKDDAALALALDTPFLREVDHRVIFDEKVRQVQMPVRSGSPLSAAFKRKHAHLHNHLLKLQGMVSIATVPQLLEQLYRLFEIRGYYFAQEDEQAIQNLEFLREIARNLFWEDQALTLHTFVEFLRRSSRTGREEEMISVASGPEDAEKRKRPPFIRVMTIHRAKGLEFPIVIVPEAQVPLIAASEEQQPPFLILDKADPKTGKPPHGLEVKIKIKQESADKQETTSPVYLQSLRLDDDKVRQEEMRILYVAVTRAENAVIFIGDAINSRYRIGHDRYSWQDEILASKTKEALRAVGARFLGVAAQSTPASSPNAT